MNERPSMTSTTGSAGGFDTEKAARLRGQARDAFVAKHRVVARITWVYLVGCMLAAWWCIRSFLAATEVRSWILWAVLFLVVFQATVLMKLWYWVVNGKLTVLREIKLLRLDLAPLRASEGTLEELMRVESPTRVPGITRWERRVWVGAIVMVAILIGAEVGRHQLRPFAVPARMTAESHVTVAEDGMVKGERIYELLNTARQPLHEYTIRAGGTITETQWISPERSGWSDGQGRKLAVRREPEADGANHRNVIQLLEPVPPGAAFRLRMKISLAAEREDDLWVIRLDQNWSGYRRHLYRDTVVLPAGAELVGVEPTPLRQETVAGATVLHLEGERASGRPWSPVVKYRLNAR